jgi:dTDP-4-amino-4,6-dideoxygalactose transaminase
LPVAEELASEVLSLPMYPELSDSQIEEVSQAVLESLDQLKTQGLSLTAS